MLSALIAGLLLGLSAGFSPGPLLALVIAQTLQHGMREGIRVAFAPFLTDVPIVLLVVLVLTQLANFKPILGIIALLGSAFVLYLASESFRAQPIAATASTVAPQSLGKGALVNLFSPHPYLFWFTVGAPTLFKAWSEAPFAAVAFVAGFYVCLIGSKIAIAWLVGKSRAWFSGEPYRWIMRGLGALLALFALVLVADGLTLLGWVR